MARFDNGMSQNPYFMTRGFHRSHNLLPSSSWNDTLGLPQKASLGNLGVKGHITAIQSKRADTIACHSEICSVAGHLYQPYPPSNPYTPLIYDSFSLVHLIQGLYQHLTPRWSHIWTSCPSLPLGCRFRGRRTHHSLFPSHLPGVSELSVSVLGAGKTVLLL